MENVNGSFVCPLLLIIASFPLARMVFPWQSHPVQLANKNVAVFISKKTPKLFKTCKQTKLGVMVRKNPVLEWLGLVG